jgi:hypothetical protein
MNWDALLEMLKSFFSNDPTMVLLLTLAFFFLKNLWPTPTPASQQVMTGFADRIRKALELGDADAAKRLADEGIAKTAEYLRTEAEPKPKGILDIFTGIFANPTLMPLLMIGGVFLLLMITGGGGGCGAKAAAFPTSQTEVSNEIRPAIFELDGASGLIRPCVYEPGMPDPWAWAGPEQADPGLCADRRGDAFADAGTSCDSDRCRLTPVAGGSGAPAADCGSGQCYQRWQTVQRPAAVSSLALRRGQPIRNAARVLARPLRWLRLPGRPFARLFGRRG